MEIFALAVVFILIIVLFRRTSKLRVELEEANRYIRMLRERMPKATVSPEAERPVVVESEAAPKAVSDLHWIESPPVETPALSLTLAEDDRPALLQAGPRVDDSAPSYFRSESWKRSERFILENLTGILGTLGVVLGLGFLGVYTALMLEPVFRSILLATVSIAIAGISGYFLRVGKWRSLAQWAQSAGFAVFLLACLGSGGIPGLQWVNDPLLAWGLLTTGVVANLGLAYMRGSPVFASVHAVLSLAALAVAGPSPIIVATMSVLAVGSLLLIRGRNWEVHLAITESVFVGLLVLFYFTGAELSEALRVVTTMGLVAVFSVGQATHYRKVRSGSSWDTSAAVTHLLVWCLTCAGLFLYAPQYELFLAPCLFFVSIVVGMVARLARRRGIL